MALLFLSIYGSKRGSRNILTGKKIPEMVSLPQTDPKWQKGKAVILKTVMTGLQYGYKENPVG